MSLFANTIHQLLQEPSISEILLNGAGSCWVEKNGSLQSFDMGSFEEEEVRTWVRSLLSAQGRRIDFLQPYADGTLSCGSRLHVVGPPVTKGLFLSIRKKVIRLPTLENMYSSGFLSSAQKQYLEKAILERKNIFLSGGTGTGKTTLLSALIQQVSKTERVIALEDVSEIQTKHPHFFSMLTRESNQEGEGEISLLDLLKQTLRMRPDRVILGECRGIEALPLLLMLNTGHAGSMGTIHANSPRESLHRLETLALLKAQNIHLESIRRLIVGGIQVVVQLKKENQTRSVSTICEVKGFDGGNYLLKEV